DPVVAIEQEAVGVVFGIFLIAIIRGHFGLLVAFAIAIGVTTEPEFGRLSDQGAASNQRERPGHHEIVQEYGSFIHPTVVVGVFENNDSAGDIGFTDPVGIGHEPPHFDDPNPSLGVE